MPQGRTEYPCHPPWWGYYFVIGLTLFLAVYIGAAVVRASIRPAPQTTMTTLVIFTGIVLFLALGAAYLAFEMRWCKKHIRPLALEDEGVRIPLYKGKPTDRFIAYRHISGLRWSRFVRPALVIEHSDGTEEILVTFLRRDQLVELWNELVERTGLRTGRG